MLSELDTRHAVLQASAREAGQLARRYFAARHTLQTTQKGIQDLVSEADRNVEALLIERLGRLFPTDGFLGEESGARGNREQLWVIDPIDGTNNFLRGIRYWAVSVAYVREGVAELGVVYDPMADELYAARRGFGATRNGEPIRASEGAELSRAVIGFTYARAHPAEYYAQAVRRLLASEGEYRRLGSAALMLAYVAEGRIDGFYGSHLNSWDVLAGLVLTREAGAWSNDFLAGDGLWQGNTVLSCATSLRGELARIIEEAGLPTAGPVR